MKCQANPVDVWIHNAGSIILFEPLTQAARDWFAAEGESEWWPWLGNRLAVDPVNAGILLVALEEHGLAWEIRS